MSVFVLLYLGVSIGWAFLWVRTYKTLTVMRLILHTLLFTFLSLPLFYIVRRVTLLPLGDSYDPSDIGALGIMIIIFTVIFVLACITAFYRNLMKLIRKDKDEKRNQS